MDVHIGRGGQLQTVELSERHCGGVDELKREGGVGEVKVWRESVGYGGAAQKFCDVGDSRR